MKKIKSKFFIVNITALVLIVVIIVALFFLWQFKDEKTFLFEAEVREGGANLSMLKENEEGAEPVLFPEEKVEIPFEFSLDVSFTSQAPFSNWEQPYQDACEEAAVLNVHYFYEGKDFTKEIADREILAFIDFENSYLGFYRSTTIAELAEVVEEYLGYNRVEIIKNPTSDDIRGQVAQGRPVIVPVAGREIGNPNFTLPGPLYHIFVIRGYDEDSFYTNDVGTRLGENYRYDIGTVMDSISDWDGVSGLSEAKRVIVIYPKS